jgi:hypothetical protein
VNVKGEWEGIPGHWLTDPQSPDGRRFIATHYGWDKVQARVRDLCGSRCEMNLSEYCQGRTQWLDTHHRRGRGGGKRDDRIYILGKRNLLGVCRPCHDLAKIESKAEVFEEATA